VFNFEKKLYPRLLNTYKRNHYILKNNKTIRITIDTNIKYYAFEKNLNYFKIGQEDFIRIELKTPAKFRKSISINHILKIFKKYDAANIISKKDAGYNYYSKYLSQKFGNHPRSNMELESKFNLKKQNQTVFQKIREDFLKNEVKGFKIYSKYPFVIEKTEFHFYVNKKNTNKNYRINLKQFEKSLVVKSNLEIIKDKFGLNNILKRKEVYIKLDPNILKLPSKDINRKRKYFIVENELGYTYCILIDRSLSCSMIKKCRELYQLEIEVLLQDPSKEELNKKIEDVAFISNFIFKKYSFLKPTTLTKQEWIYQTDN